MRNVFLITSKIITASSILEYNRQGSAKNEPTIIIQYLFFSFVWGYKVKILCSKVTWVSFFFHCFQCDYYSFEIHLGLFFKFIFHFIVSPHSFDFIINFWYLKHECGSKINTNWKVYLEKCQPTDSSDCVSNQDHWFLVFLSVSFCKQIKNGSYIYISLL